MDSLFTKHNTHFEGTRSECWVIYRDDNNERHVIARFKCLRKTRTVARDFMKFVTMTFSPAEYFDACKDKPPLHVAKEAGYIHYFARESA